MKNKLNIALVAHDGRKQELISWVKYNHTLLSEHNLYAIGTTGRLISEITTEVEDGKLTAPFKDKVTRLLSGPLGGDRQIGAMIAEGKIDAHLLRQPDRSGTPERRVCTYKTRRTIQHSVRDQQDNGGHDPHVFTAP